MAAKEAGRPSAPRKASTTRDHARSRAKRSGPETTAAPTRLTLSTLAGVRPRQDVRQG
jgi:hypothetical protein